MKQKRWCILLALTLGLTGCGGGQTAAPEPDPAPPAVSDGTEVPEKTGAEPLRLLHLLQSSDGLQEWGEDAPVCTADWDSLRLSAGDEADFPALAAAFDRINADTRAGMQTFFDENLPDAQEMAAEHRDWFSGFTSACTYAVQRADAQLVSIRVDTSEHTGGAHPNYGSFGLNLDPATGEEVGLTDVMTDLTGLPALLAEKIEAGCEVEPFGDVAEMLSGYAPEQYAWTVDYQGITFYFSPYELAPYAAGLLTATVRFDEAPARFAPACTAQPAYGFAEPLWLWRENALDGGSLLIQPSRSDESDAYDGFELIWNGQTYAEKDWYTYELTPYWVRLTADGGQSFLYMETLSDNDYRTLSVYALTGEGVKPVGDLPGTGFHSALMGETGWQEVFNDPARFTLDTRIDLLGTMTGTRVCRTQPGDGLPRAETDSYALPADFPPLVTKRALEVTRLPDGKETRLPAGTQLSFLRTDGESYVELRTADGQDCRLDVARGDTEWTVNGVSEWDCFEELRYAG